MKRAFTMAEILLSLTIIGVVAAITLPSLIGNINERVWNTQKKTFYARMSQALALIGNLKGFGSYEGSWSDGSTSVTKDTVTEAFVTEGLSKVLKINNICDAEHIGDCGINSTITTIAGNQIIFPKRLSELKPSIYVEANKQKHIDSAAVAFETQNGECVVAFYNPSCEIDNQEHNVTASFIGNARIFTHTKICANFIYDLNGTKGPNTVGKDIGFITVIYPFDPIITAPEPLSTQVNGSFKQTDVSKACQNKDKESRVPKYYELWAMAFNGNLIDFNSGTYWSIDRTDTGYGRAIWPNQGRQLVESRSVPHSLRCVKR